ncbi:MAG: phage portal protein, partial [Clostridium sp.]
TSDIKDDKELKKVQNRFDKLYSSNGRTFTVPAGYNVQPMNLSLSDAQFEQLRRMSISQIASSFGIKMFQLNDLKDTNNNSLEQQQLSFLIDTLLILFESIEQELDWKVLNVIDRAKGYKFRFNTNVMLRTNAESQANILSKYVTSGIYTPNEARLMLQKQKLAGADELIVNAGVLKIKDLGKEVKKSE